MGIRAKGRRGLIRQRATRPAHMTRHTAAQAGDPVRRGFSALSHGVSGILDRPPSRAMTARGALRSADAPDFHLPLSPNIRGSLFMAVGMASFTINDAITKLVSSEMNFGQVMLVRGLFATVLIAALALHRARLASATHARDDEAGRAARGGRSRRYGGISDRDRALAAGQYRRDFSGAAAGRHPRGGARFSRTRWLAPLAGDHQRALSAFSSSSGRAWKVLTSTRCSRSARWCFSPCAISRPGQSPRTFLRCSLRW